MRPCSRDLGAQVREKIGRKGQEKWDRVFLIGGWPGPTSSTAANKSYSGVYQGADSERKFLQQRIDEAVSLSTESLFVQITNKIVPQ